MSKPLVADDEFPGYSLKERDRRWRLTREYMSRVGLDCLVVFGNDRFPINNYLINDRLDLVVIFPRSGDVTALGWSTQVVAQHIESKLRGEDLWIEDLRHGSRAQHIVAVLKEKGVEKGTIGAIGVEAAGLQFEGYVPYTTWKGVLEGLPKATFRNVWKDYAPIVLTKSDEEIEVLKKAAAAGEAACEAMMEVTRPGVTEIQIYAAAMDAMTRRGMRASWMILHSGPECFGWGQPIWTVRPQRSRTIQAGDIINGEIFPHYGMLEAQIQVCLAVGKISAVNERCAEVARAGYEAGLAALKPGVLFGDLVKAMEKPVDEIGAWHLTPMIHSINPLDICGSVGIGIEKNLPTIERYKNVVGRPTFGGDVVIRSGMSFAFEPNCSIGATRVNIGGTVVARDGAPLELNTLPNHMQRVRG